MSTKTVKVVLVGEASVGKTSIIHRYVDDKFNPNVLTSLGASFVSKTIHLADEGTNIKFDIWDTAGQEKYRSLAKIFYKDAVIIIFVYDITNRKSFEEVKKFWFNQTKINGPVDPIYAIAANKNDLYSNEQITEQEGRRYADEIGAIFVNTSALSNTGIDILFEYLAKKYMDTSFDYKKEEKVEEDVQNEKEVNGSFNISKSSAADKKDKNAEEKEKKKKCC